MQWQLLEVALRADDLKTTASLACLNKKVNGLFFEYDIWRLKFDREFNSVLYQAHWAAKENYQLQKEGGIVQVTGFQKEDDEEAKEIKLDFGQPLQQYCFYLSEDEEDFVFKRSFASKKEAAAKIHQKILNKIDNYQLFLVLDITSLVSPKNCSFQNVKHWCVEANWMHAYYKPALLDIENLLQC